MRSGQSTVMTGGGGVIINPKTSQKSKGGRIQLIFTGLTYKIMICSKEIRTDFMWLPLTLVSATKHHQILALAT